MRSWDETLTLWALERNVNTSIRKRENFETSWRRFYCKIEWTLRRNRVEKWNDQWWRREISMTINRKGENVSWRNEWKKTDGVANWKRWFAKSNWFLEIWVRMNQKLDSLERFWIWAHEIENSTRRKMMTWRNLNRLTESKSSVRKAKLSL